MKEDKDKKIGSVLVIGGGITGIQAATDLSESGFYVYLIEKSPSIGGVMSQLDKTFPTNDCSMCILSPKLVECGRHLNINIMTLSEVESIKGNPGNFKVRVRKKSSYVDPEKCTGCGECFEVCPVSVPNEFDQGLKNRKAIYRPFPQAYPNIATIEKKSKPCQITCPAGVHAQGYIALIGEKKYKEAFELEKKDNPLPAICGRICHHPCESECKRGLLDNPLAIQYLKRFLADWEMNQKDYIKPIAKKPFKKGKVAVIGAGPAGVSCANYLVQEGYKVTIFEKLSTTGGMLKVGIPAYRLPKEILDKEINSIISLGVKLKLNTELGKDISLDELKKMGYKSIFISIGAHKGLPLRISGEESKGVKNGVGFLRDVNLNKKVVLGEKVVVIGGGNVALDAARSSLRLGAKEVNIVYRRSKKEMPANPWEIEEAIEEGIKIEYLITPVEILNKNGKVTGIKCLKNKLGAPDLSGRRSPVPIKNSDFIIHCDNVISAIGQKPESTFLEKEIKIDRDLILIDKDTLMTSKKGIFAGGDAVLGPATAIEAIAHGKKAAQSIISYLSGEEIKNELVNNKIINYGDLPWNKPYEGRKTIKRLHIKERIVNFNEVESGFIEEEAIAEAKRCLNCGICSECMECVKICKANAIDHNMKDEVVELNVGAVIMSSGYEAYKPGNLYKYGYSRFDNVITSLEFERILSASGPYDGEVARPSDKKHPKKIAFLQCIGSRDESNNLGYCSAVCCMYAIKESIIAKEHAGKELETVIFYMDIRCYGKDFEKYYERAKIEYGVKFVKSKVYELNEKYDSKNILIKYCDEIGEVKIDEFDLVVLSIGLKPSPDVINLCKKLNLSLNEYNFLSTPPFFPAVTFREGIFSCGVINGPKDIPESVIEASTASGHVNNFLFSVKKTLTQEKTYIDEIDIFELGNRIGVFICHCGINIGGYIDVEEVKEYAKKLPDVVYADTTLYTCSQDSLDNMKVIIKEKKLTKIVVASCTPQTHEPLFQDTIREAGLNKYLFEMANIRDQCSWVHMSNPKEATEKAKDLVFMAVCKAALLEPLQEREVTVNNNALVIGGGVSGLNAALNLGNQGSKVYIIEKTNELGGLARKIKYTIDNYDVSEYLSNLIAKVKNNPQIEIILNSNVKSVDGFVGNFTTTVRSNNNGETRKIEHGVVLVTVGAGEYNPHEYLYKKNKNVITQLDLEEIICQKNNTVIKWQRIVMIQCVGSREKDRPYCSRFCCQQAVKNALLIKQINPECNIYILYRDIRTYGLYEEYYLKAREEGIVFIKYDVEDKPEVKVNDKKELEIEVFEKLVNKKIKFIVDKVILSTGIESNKDNHELGKILKVPINKDGNFLEAHVKLRPVEFATDGVFLAGICHSPKTITESIAQGIACASRASSVLSNDYLVTQGAISRVNDNICNACGMCEDICPYKAIEVKDKQKGKVIINVAVVNEIMCKGCGLCASICPSSAIDIYGFTNKEILEQIKVGV